MRYEELSGLSNVVRKEVLTGELSRRVKNLPTVPPADVDPLAVGAAAGTGRHAGVGSGSAGFGACSAVAAWARNSTRRTLPVAVVGYSVTKITRRGRL